MNQRRKRFLASLVLGSLLALPTAGWAQEADVLRLRVDRPAGVDRFITLFGAAAESAGEDDAPTGRWIGVQVTELPPVLQKHLRLDHGVLAEAVMPDTPAQKAGIEQFDVLLKIGGDEITSPEQVRDAVAAAGEGVELSLELLHDGQRKTVKLTPAERPETPPATSAPAETTAGAAASQQEFLNHQHQAMKALERALADRQAAGMMFMRPGIVTQRPQELPAGVTVNIQRSAGAPARITVERGKDRWEVTEGTLDKLPEDLRAPVAAMVHGPMPFNLNLRGHDEVVQIIPQQPDADARREVPAPKIRQRREADQRDGQMEAVLKELKAVRKQLNELQNALQQHEE